MHETIKRTTTALTKSSSSIGAVYITGKDDEDENTVADNDNGGELASS